MAHFTTAKVVAMSDQSASEVDRERAAFNNILGALHELDKGAQSRILRAVQTFLDIGAINQRFEPSYASPRDSGIDTPNGSRTSTKPSVPFSAEVEVLPKEFLREKQPHTAVERMACLAFYLTNYLETAVFRTLDLTKLNTEAAHPKFTNASKAAANALQYGYFAHAAKKGSRQLSAAGEEFVMALPDRVAAKAAMARARPRRRQRNTKT